MLVEFASQMELLFKPIDLMTTLTGKQQSKLSSQATLLADHYKTCMTLPEQSM
jgi:hypothetical protein